MSASRSTTLPGRTGSPFLGRLALAALALTSALAFTVMMSSSASSDPKPFAVLAMQDAARRAGIPEAQLPRLTAQLAQQEKATRAPWQQKLNSIVLDRISAVLGSGRLGTAAEPSLEDLSLPVITVDRKGRVLVEARVNDSGVFTNDYFASIGGVLVESADGINADYLTAWVPVGQMETFASRPDVRMVKHLDPTYTNLGTHTSQGDAMHDADDARTKFGLNGNGITVGVISNGVVSRAFAQGTGDLPAAVNAVCVGSGDEGTAMLEIVADLAPNANLAFCGAGGGTAGMLNAITSMRGVAGMDIITDDLANPQEPLFEAGPIALAYQAASNAGIFYTASAGNRAGQHYQGNFNATGSNVTFGPSTFQNPHNFGGGDVRLSIMLAANNDVYFQWAEPFGGASTDYDLYVIDNAGNVLASSTNTQNGSQDPVETLSFAATAGTAAHIVVDYTGGGTAPVRFIDLRSFRVGWNEFLVTAGSMDGAARQPEAYAAGAINQATPNTIEGFSARGPGVRFFPSFQNLQKPDGSAADGVTVSGAGCFGCGASCPPVPAAGCNFFGTSAATPHVAGMAALLLQAFPTLTPAQVANAFNTTANDIGTPGTDFNTGAGRLDMDAAICSQDNQAPNITCPASISVECTGNDGALKTNPAIVTFLAGASATDNLSLNPSITNNAPAFFPVGATTVMFSATDDCGNVATCNQTVTVVDTQNPSITCPADISVECTQSTGTPATDPAIAAFLAAATASDVCDPSPAITTDAPAFFLHGFTTVTFTATDNSGHTASCQAKVRVIDTTPPVISVALSRYSLWPPNHRLAPITATVVVSDVCDPSPTHVLTTITSNEPDNGLGDGDTANDIQGAAYGTPDHQFSLRSERSGTGSGRRYTIIYTASDGDGNTAADTVEVRVAHDQSGAAVAAGQDPAGVSIPGEQVYRIGVLSNPELDATTLDVNEVLVGNHLGVVASAAHDVRDFDHDGLADLELTFPGDAVASLLALEDEGEHFAAGLHYVNAEGISFWLPDILALPLPSQSASVIEPAIGRAATFRPEPNPFARLTRLTYAVPVGAPGRVSVSVFDAAGRRVRNLFDGVQSTGNYTVTWDGLGEGGRSLRNGLYFYRLQIGPERMVRRVALLR